MPQDYFRQPKNLDHAMSPEALNALYPNLNLQDYFNLRALPKHFVINNCTPDYLEKLNAYLKTIHPKPFKIICYSPDA